MDLSWLSYFFLNLRREKTVSADRVAFDGVIHAPCGSWFERQLPPVFGKPSPHGQFEQCLGIMCALPRPSPSWTYVFPWVWRTSWNDVHRNQMLLRGLWQRSRICRPFHILNRQKLNGLSATYTFVGRVPCHRWRSADACFSLLNAGENTVSPDRSPKDDFLFKHETADG